VSRRAVFLDRDGVLNEVVLRAGRPHPPGNLAELRILPEAKECLLELKRLGFLLIVVSNQPDVARGTQTRAAVEEINGYLAAQLPIDDTYVCYHDEADRCDCRKPAPGLLLQAARKHDIQITDSFFIGDRWRDVEAGNRANCTTLLIDNGYAEPSGAADASFVARSLKSAVEWIVATAAATR
jgi:D-glycero-D-manno-heptose 1,7-bisphosphate phosphatase